VENTAVPKHNPATGATAGPAAGAIAKALYLNAALLALILVVLLVRSNTPEFLPAALAQAQPSVAGGNGLYVVPAQFHPQVWGCFLLNTDTQTLCTYEYEPGPGQLKLTSARDVRYDTQMKNFATTPAPWEVQSMVEQEKKNEQARQNPTPAPK